MPHKTLTPHVLKNAKKAKPGTRYMIWDKRLPGFGLRVTDGGHRSFIVRGRIKGKPQPVRRTIGDYPALALADARETARAWLAALERGVDPAALVAEELAAAEKARRQAARLKEGTFEKVSAKFIDSYAKAHQRRWQETERIFRVYVSPEWSARPMHEIKRRDVADLLDNIAAENGIVMADRVLAAIRKLFNWHAARDDDFVSPIVKGIAKTKPAQRARKRILSDDEVGAIWPLLDRDEFKPAFGPCLKLLFLSGQRKNEAAHLKRNDIAHANGHGEIWTIPEESYKSKIDHVIPITAALRLVLDAQPVLGDAGLYFTTDGETHFQGFNKKKAELDKLSGVKGWTIHDIRRTAHSLMTRAGVSHFVADRVLGHKIAGVGGTYNRYDYIKEKRAALETLAAEIDRILNPPADNVVPLRSAPSG